MIKSSPGLRYRREMLIITPKKFFTTATQYIMNIKYTKVHETHMYLYGAFDF